MLLAIRCVLLTTLVWTVWSARLQACVDLWWETLRHHSWFCSVYFETIYTTIIYTIILIAFALLRTIPALDKYQIDSSTRMPVQGRLYTFQLIFYVIPLLLLDTFTIKRYGNMPIRNDGQFFLFFQWTTSVQHVRDLPMDAPNVGCMLVQIIAAIFVYDVLFSVLHFLLHRISWLYRSVHRVHHSHSHGLTPDYTAHLHAIENIALVLTANISLKLVQAHPLTRAVYVPCLLFMLIDNHSGYDFPWNYDKWIPGHLLGGSRMHYLHHVTGRAHYQPFFHYLDSLYRRLTASLM